MAAHKAGPGAIGLKLLNFSRVRINHYVPQPNFTSRATLPPSWQEAAETPLVWKASEVELPPPPEPVMEEEAVPVPDQPATAAPREGKIAPDLLRILELHQERQAREQAEKSQLPEPPRQRPPAVQRNMARPKPGLVAEVTPKQAAPEESAELPEVDSWDAPPAEAMPPVEYEVGELSPNRGLSQPDEQLSESSPVKPAAPRPSPKADQPAHKTHTQPESRVQRASTSDSTQTQTEQPSVPSPATPFAYAPESPDEPVAEGAPEAYDVELDEPAPPVRRATVYEPPNQPSFVSEPSEQRPPASEPPPAAPSAKQPEFALPLLDDDGDTEQIDYANVDPAAGMSTPAARASRLEAIQRSLESVQESLDNIQRFVETPRARKPAPANPPAASVSEPGFSQQTDDQANEPPAIFDEPSAAMEAKGEPPEYADYPVEAAPDSQSDMEWGEPSYFAAEAAPDVTSAAPHVEYPESPIPDGVRRVETIEPSDDSAPDAEAFAQQVERVEQPDEPRVSPVVQRETHEPTAPTQTPETHYPDMALEAIPDDFEWTETLPVDSTPVELGPGTVMPSVSEMREFEPRLWPKHDDAPQSASPNVIQRRAVEPEEPEADGGYTGSYDEPEAYLGETGSPENGADSADADLLRLLNLPPDTRVVGRNSPASSPSLARAPFVEDEQDWQDGDVDEPRSNPVQPLPLDEALLSNGHDEAVQRTPTDNSALESSGVEEETGAEGENGAEPNVDRLARDVYRLLRARLRIEQERRTDK